MPVCCNHESRLTQIVYPNGATNAFAHNGLDARVGRTDSGGTRTFKRDGAGVTDAVLSDGVSAYTPGVSTRTSGATRFNLADRLGTFGIETNASQTITATKQYDAFGLPLSSTGSSASVFGFAGGWGYQEDPDSGLKLLGHRYYDPSTGRFLTRDPAKDGRNWYGYCENNPHKYVDPVGLHTMAFDGDRLYWYDDDGNLIDSTPAYSGKPGSTPTDQNTPNFGPIPEGEYYIDPDEDQYRSYNPFGILFGMGYPFWLWEPWGDRRIPIHAAPGNNTKRGGFFLHGGVYIGSAGCIDIGSADVKWIDRIGKHKGRIKMIVKYKPGTKVPGKGENDGKGRRWKDNPKPATKIGGGSRGTTD